MPTKDSTMVKRTLDIKTPPFLPDAVWMKAAKEQPLSEK